ncbi:hypothetical protein SEA_TARDUS_59 [Gordonia phage Tardus]|uniref:DNA-binding phage zinc finger domain-containing protein n=1 Tax=Gordonia phage Tardus TaxID=2939734 RepID=A0A9E7J749_9CAUD|nr:hypothetical protein SEA_TARDUS_59 [Gordonia phage Tardus]
MPKSADWHHQRTASLTVPCPHCRAPIGSVCRNNFTGRELHGLPAHTPRVRLADDHTHADSRPLMSTQTPEQEPPAPE